MDEMVAFCGITCQKCGAFLATKTNDDEKRAKVARLWSKEFKSDIKPEDINCAGCLSDSENLFNYSKTCEIRKCGKDKGVVNCAHCNDYACEKLEKLFNMVPSAKTRLDSIKAKL